MAGAYVAKPDATPDPPDVPPDWNPDWPFPGPFPPGYEPSYSLNVSASESISYSGTLSPTVTLRDHVSYRTGEPLPGATIRWTASLDGESVDLKFDGGDYASQIVSTYSAVGDYWGAEPDILFDIDETANGKTLTLTATTTIGSNVISRGTEIAVGVRTAIINISWTFAPLPGDQYDGSVIRIRAMLEEEPFVPGSSNALWLNYIYYVRQTPPFVSENDYTFGPAMPEYDEIEYQFDYLNGNGECEINVGNVRDVDYHISSDLEVEYASVSIVMTLTILLDGEIESEKTVLATIENISDEYEDSGAIAPWIKVNFSTGEIDIVNSEWHISSIYDPD
jgi:hypothetical protein